MSENGKSRIPEVLQKYEKELLADWVREQLATPGVQSKRIADADLHQQANEFLRLLCKVTQNGSLTDIMTSEWGQVREMLAGLSRTWAQQGFTSAETAMFVFSLKQPLFACLHQEIGADAERFSSEIWTATVLLDQLGLYTTQAYQKSREEIITRQQQEMIELSTPVVKLWEGILVLPLIGTLDSARTQVVMESLLNRIVETSSNIAIIDITGVPTVDTLVAQHLLRTVAAARLMGADCIISGIRPQIAQTIIYLGVTLSEVTTRATLSDAVALAFQRNGFVITRPQARS